MKHMEYKGYNGQIVVEGETLVITHSGLAAKAGGLASDQPRRIPLQAISGVGFKEASRMTNGWLSLGLGGQSAPQHGTGNAASNADTVMFRHKEKDAFGQLHAWLEGVVAHNQEHGIDPTAVAYDAAVQTRTERVEEWSQGVQAKAAAKAENSGTGRQAKQEAKMTALLGDERADIVAAAARMGWRMGGKRELKHLAEHLHEGETVRFIAQGTYHNDQGILVLTDVRLIFLFHGVVSQRKEDFPLKLISSVETKSGLATGEIRIFVSGNNAEIKGIIKSDLVPLADAVRQGMAAQHALPPAPLPAPTAQETVAAPAAAVDDPPFEALQKLKGLHDGGVITDEEFEAKKSELLGRM